jgi:hypothetical protein
MACPGCHQSVTARQRLEELFRTRPAHRRIWVTKRENLMPNDSGETQPLVTQYH